jgi:glycosyltransferase involved in cell wall biosynthesis
MTKDIAIIRGPWFRPNSTLLWEYVHNEYDDVDITGFGSDPSWFDTSELELPIETLQWWDGKVDAFGHENLVYQLLEKYKLPNIALSGIRRIVREYDAVHVTENFRIYSYYAALLCARADTRLFVDSHENIPHRPRNPVTWAVKRTVNRHADGFTSPTMASKRALIHEGVDADRIHILPNVVDFERFDAGPKDANRVSLPDRLESTCNFLFVHGLSEQKGTHFLLQAFEDVQAQFDDVSLILLGDNSLESSYYDTHVTGNPDVYHVEYVPEIQHLYNLSDIFVLPSIAVQRWKEQFGRAIIESMACGIPSIVTNVGGPPLVVEDGETSLVVEPRSANALADAMTKLCGEDGLRREMGENAYKYVRENYAPEAVGEDLYELYRSHLF